MLRAVGREPIFVGYTYVQGASSSTSSVSVEVPTEAQSGDLLVAYAVGSTFSGGNFITSSAFSGDLEESARYVGVKNWSAGPFTFTQSVSGGGGTLRVILMAFRTANYDDVGELGIASTNCVAPSISLTKGNSIVIAAYSTTASSTGTYTTPTGYTAIYNSGTNIAAFYKSGVASGATGTVTSTASSASSRGVLIGVNPK
jgi:hypothetical protein